jgi:hypothetical protein
MYMNDGRQLQLKCLGNYQSAKHYNGRLLEIQRKRIQACYYKIVSNNVYNCEYFCTQVWLLMYTGVSTNVHMWEY